MSDNTSQHTEKNLNSNISIDEISPELKSWSLEYISFYYIPSVLKIPPDNKIVEWLYQAFVSGFYELEQINPFKKRKKDKPADKFFLDRIEKGLSNISIFDQIISLFNTISKVTLCETLNALSKKEYDHIKNSIINNKKKFLHPDIEKRAKEIIQCVNNIELIIKSLLPESLNDFLIEESKGDFLKLLNLRIITINGLILNVILSSQDQAPLDYMYYEEKDIDNVMKIFIDRHFHHNNLDEYIYDVSISIINLEQFIHLPLPLKESLLSTITGQLNRIKEVCFNLNKTNTKLKLENDPKNIKNILSYSDLRDNMFRRILPIDPKITLDDISIYPSEIQSNKKGRHLWLKPTIFRDEYNQEDVAFPSPDSILNTIKLIRKNPLNFYTLNQLVRLQDSLEALLNYQISINLKPKINSLEERKQTLMSRFKINEDMLTEFNEFKTFKKQISRRISDFRNSIKIITDDNLNQKTAKIIKEIFEEFIQINEDIKLSYDQLKIDYNDLEYLEYLYKHLVLVQNELTKLLKRLLNNYITNSDNLYSNSDLQSKLASYNLSNFFEAYVDELGRISIKLIEPQIFYPLPIQANYKNIGYLRKQLVKLDSTLKLQLQLKTIAFKEDKNNSLEVLQALRDQALLRFSNSLKIINKKSNSADYDDNILKQVYPPFSNSIEGWIKHEEWLQELLKEFESVSSNINLNRIKLENFPEIVKDFLNKSDLNILLKTIISLLEESHRHSPSNLLSVFKNHVEGINSNKIYFKSDNIYRDLFNYFFLILNNRIKFVKGYINSLENHAEILQKLEFYNQLGKLSDEEIMDKLTDSGLYKNEGFERIDTLSYFPQDSWLNTSNKEVYNEQISSLLNKMDSQYNFFRVIIIPENLYNKEQIIKFIKSLIADRPKMSSKTKKCLDLFISIVESNNPILPNLSKMGGMSLRDLYVILYKRFDAAKAYTDRDNIELKIKEALKFKAEGKHFVKTNIDALITLSNIERDLGNMQDEYDAASRTLMDQMRALDLAIPVEVLNRLSPTEQ